ncbi:MAG: hypothetical protein HZR80_18600 [Candidatus Heimdallarchaeota archaeon]
MLLEKFRHKKPTKEQILSAEELVSIITLEEDPFDSNDNVVEQAEKAKKRTQACIDLQFINRDLEGEVLGAISQFQKSPIIEQQWLAFIALRFYLLGGISNYKYLSSLLKNVTLHERFIIRQECFDAANSLFITQPEFGLQLIKDFLSSKNKIHQFYGLKYVHEFEAYKTPLFCNTHRWSDFENKQIKPKKKLVKNFKSLVMQSKDIVIELYENLVQTGHILEI